MTWECIGWLLIVYQVDRIIVDAGAIVTGTFLASEVAPQIDDTCITRLHHRPLGP